MEENGIWCLYLYHHHPPFVKESILREEKVDCYVCGKIISNLDTTYVCSECDPSDTSRFILHKRCGELPLYIHILEDHTLRLTDFHRSWDARKCNFCRGSLDNLVGYRCECCKIRFHTTCVDAFVNGNKELQHPSHPHHPLTLIRKPPFRFKCDGSKLMMWTWPTYAPLVISGFTRLVLCCRPDSPPITTTTNFPWPSLFRRSIASIVTTVMFVVRIFSNHRGCITVVIADSLSISIVLGPCSNHVITRKFQFFRLCFFMHF